MIVTNKMLRDNGAILSASYMSQVLCSPVGHKPVCRSVGCGGSLESLYDTDLILKSILRKRSNTMSDYSRNKMEKVLSTVEKAVYKIIGENHD